MNYASFLFDNRATPERARALLPRALQSLEKSNHFDITLKFAQLEFRSTSGEAERGRTLFEGLISSFPKRLDLWNVLLDHELKLGDTESIRKIFQRVTSGKLKPKQAEYFFRRWLVYEEKQGEGSQFEKVKAKAQEYVQEQHNKATVENIKG